MRKQVLLWALAGMAVFQAQAQTEYETRVIVSEPEPTPVTKRATTLASGAEYGYPAGLRNLGMISQDDNACCNFLSFNKVIPLLQLLKQVN